MYKVNIRVLEIMCRAMASACECVAPGGGSSGAVVLRLQTSAESAGWDDDATRRVYAFGFGSGGYLLMLMCVESRDGARMMRDSPMCDVRTKKEKEEIIGGAGNRTASWAGICDYTALYQTQAVSGNAQRLLQKTDN